MAEKAALEIPLFLLGYRQQFHQVHQYLLTKAQTGQRHPHNSLFQLMKVDLPIPDHTTLSRRSSKLDIQIKRPSSAGKPMHCTGLSIHGDGPWSEHKHGGGKKRGRMAKTAHFDRPKWLHATYSMGW